MILDGNYDRPYLLKILYMATDVMRWRPSPRARRMSG